MKFLPVSLILASLVLAGRVTAAKYLSPAALAASADGKTVFVACATADRVEFFDTERGRVAGAVTVPFSPSGLAVTADGRRLYVTCAAPVSEVCTVDVTRRKIIGTIPTGHTSGAPVLSPDGRTLFVCNQFDNDVSVLDLAAGRETRRIRVRREPVAADITPDGKYLLVANHLSDTAANLKFVAAVVSVIDVAAGRVVKELQLPSGSEMLKGLRVSPDGKYAVVTHIFCNYDLPALRVDLGLMNANALSVIDLANLELRYTLLLDEPTRGAANPWGAAFSADGRTLAVAHAGTHEVSLIDFPALLAGLPEVDRKLAWPTNLSTAVLKFVPHYEDEESNDGLPFLVGARERVPLPAGDRVPRAIIIAGRKVYTADYLSDTLSVINLADAAPRVARSLGLGSRKAMDSARRGDLYFHDATLCVQGWQSCSSCHPGNGRVDALNWDLPSDGLGNPRNSKSVLYAHRVAAITRPNPAATNQMGGGASAETAVRVALKTLFLTNQPEPVAAALDEYLKSLRPVPSPYLAQGRLSAAAERGRVVFTRANCSHCHVPGLFTDGLSHEVGTGAAYDGPSPRFYTPSLVEVWRTAPYLHTGAAPTVRDVLTTCNPNDGRHGDVAGLSAQELDDLCEYVLSL